MNNSIVAIIIKGLKAEFIKAKGTRLLLIALAVPLFVNICVFLIGKNASHSSGSAPWFGLTRISISLLAFNMLLMAVIAIISLSIQTENKSNAWKHLLTLPVPQWTVYVSKFLFLLGLLILIHVLMLALMLLNGWLLSMVRPDLGLGNEAPNLYMMGGNLSKVFLSTLSVFAIQYWFSLRVKNYMIPIFIGGFAVMIFTFANMMGWKKCIYIPYAYTSIVERYVGGMKKMDTIGGLPHFLWWGVAGFFVIGIAAVVDAVYKRVKA